MSGGLSGGGVCCGNAGVSVITSGDKCEGAGVGKEDMATRFVSSSYHRRHNSFGRVWKASVVGLGWQKRSARIVDKEDGDFRGWLQFLFLVLKR